MNNNILQLTAEFCAISNIYINSLCSEKFNEILSHANPFFRCIKRNYIRRKIFEIFNKIQYNIKTECDDKFCSLLIDGSTRNSKNFYGFIIHTKSRLFYYKIESIEYASSQNIVLASAEVIKFINTETNLELISVCTDHAFNCIKAFNNIVIPIIGSFENEFSDIQKKIKRPSLPIEVVHSHWKDGGMNIPRLKHRLELLRIQSFLSLLTCKDERVRNLIKHNIIDENEKRHIERSDVNSFVGFSKTSLGPTNDLKTNILFTGALKAADKLVISITVGDQFANDIESPDLINSSPMPTFRFVTSFDDESKIKELLSDDEQTHGRTLLF